MRNLVVGNGINIQFDHKAYTAQAIVLRILEELDLEGFPRHIIMDQPILLKYYIGKLFLFSRKMIDGACSNSTICTAEREALDDFIERYKNKKRSLRITDIGFEDYYLVHDLFCHEHGVANPNQYIIRESLRRAYLFSIYNHGRINCLYNSYEESFKSYLEGFDHIFTTNYDSNIESAIGKPVFHIHGQFDRLSEVYNPNSFRNHLHDSPLEDSPIDLAYSYLYSTALSTYCGDYKQYLMKETIVANKVIDKLANAYSHDEKIQTDVDSLEKNSNYLVTNLADSIKLKIANPKLRFQEDYPVRELEEIAGSLVILGLSPCNDSHLFDIIDHAAIDECIYYYFDPSEQDRVKSIFPTLQASGKLKFQSVREFWKNINEEN